MEGGRCELVGYGAEECSRPGPDGALCEDPRGLHLEALRSVVDYKSLQREFRRDDLVRLGELHRWWTTIDTAEKLNAGIDL